MNVAAFWAEAAACTGILFCPTCRARQRCTTAHAARYLRTGWPTCCHGLSMILVREGSEIPGPAPRSPRRSLGCAGRRQAVRP